MKNNYQHSQSWRSFGGGHGSALQQGRAWLGVVGAWFFFAYKFGRTAGFFMPQETKKTHARVAPLQTPQTQQQNPFFCYQNGRVRRYRLLSGHGGLSYRDIGGAKIGTLLVHFWITFSPQNLFYFCTTPVLLFCRSFAVVSPNMKSPKFAAYCSI